MRQPKAIIDLWMDLCEQVCERDALLSWSEHLMYIGQKLSQFVEAIESLFTCKIEVYVLFYKK